MMNDFFLDLYEMSEGQEIGLDASQFSDALVAVQHRYLAANASQQETLAFYKSLHIQDFALARACVQGSAPAWERFIGRYREKLFIAAMIIAKNDSVAREMADSLSGDLFGSRSCGADCKLGSYSGRGTLEGWLKSILSHA